MCTGYVLWWHPIRMHTVSTPNCGCWWLECVCYRGWIYKCGKYNTGGCNYDTFSNRRMHICSVLLTLPAPVSWAISVLHQCLGPPVSLVTTVLRQCLAPPVSWATSVLGHQCPGPPVSWATSVLGHQCLGLPVSWATSVLGYQCLG